MKTKALTLEEIDSFFSSGEDTMEVNIVINEINKQLTNYRHRNPKCITFVIHGEGYKDNIRLLYNDAYDVRLPDRKLSIRTLNLALKEFRKNWTVRLDGKWDSQYSRLEFTPKKK